MHIFTHKDYTEILLEQHMPEPSDEMLTQGETQAYERGFVIGRETAKEKLRVECKGCGRFGNFNYVVMEMA